MEEVTIEDMMYCRERRAAIQKQYLDKYQKTVISFSMNIPGPIKTNDNIKKAFNVGVIEINKVLNKHNLSIVDYNIFHDKTGDELTLCIDGNAPYIKKIMCKIEEEHPLGRLYDIDVLDKNGIKLSRPYFRKCIICNCKAQECSRSRKHSVEEMLNKITKMIDDYN